MASKLKTQEVILQSPNGLVEKTIAVSDSGIVNIPTSNLNSTVWSSSQMPSGSVLQVLVNNLPLNLGETTISTTTTTSLPNWSYTINKIKSNSTIVCFASVYLYYASSPSYWGIKAFANGSAVTSAAKYSTGTYIDNAVATYNHTQYTFSGAAHQMFNFQFSDSTNASTVAFTYSIQQNAAGNLRIWDYGKPLFIYMEIAA